MSTKYLEDCVKYRKNPKVREKAKLELLRRKTKLPIGFTEPLLRPNNSNVGRKVLVKKDPIEVMNEEAERHFKTI